MTTRFATSTRLVLLAVVLGLPAATGFELGSRLPRPDQIRGGLVQPKRFALPPVELAETTRVVVFFYSASWCAPCKQVAAALRQTHADFRTRAPGLQLITYSVDHSPRSRADYLRDETFPWPALGPALIEDDPWLADIPGGTPQFQAFAVATDHLEAITSPGPADQVMNAALAFLHQAETDRAP
jgi:thiol-disulfide isomerase/thioredoxin